MLYRHARTPAHVLVVAGLVLAMTVLLAAPTHAAFEDTRGTVHEEAVRALVGAGIVEGCEEDAFCPHDPISRAQLASLLARALELPGSETEHFSDVTGVHAASIDALAEAGIVDGCGEDRFCPGDPVTRAQAASMIARAFDLPPAEESWFDDGGPTHGPAMDQLAEAGIADGCGDPLTHFCGHYQLSRGQTALLVARGSDLVERVQVDGLEERRERQAEIDAHRQTEVREAEPWIDPEREQIWDDLAECESGGDWYINTGNGYYGGLQFSLSSWQWVGGEGYPHHHSREEQVHRAEILLERQGWDAWPSCSRQLGYQ
jgi:hypothetical protein